MVSCFIHQFSDEFAPPHQRCLRATLRRAYPELGCIGTVADFGSVPSLAAACGPLQPIRDVCFHGEFRRITGHSVDAKKAKRIRAGRFLPWTATRTDVCERASGETPVRETVDFKRELDKDFDIWPARGSG